MSAAAVGSARGRVRSIEGGVGWSEAAVLQCCLPLAEGFGGAVHAVVPHGAAASARSFSGSPASISRAMASLSTTRPAAEAAAAREGSGCKRPKH